MVKASGPPCPPARTGGGFTFPTGVEVRGVSALVDHTSLCDHDDTRPASGPHWATGATGVEDDTGSGPRAPAREVRPGVVPFRPAHRPPARTRHPRTSPKDSR